MQHMWKQVRWADGWLRPGQGLNSHVALETGTRDPGPRQRRAGPRLPKTWRPEGGFQELSPPGLAW